MSRRRRRRPEKPFDVALAATLHDPPGALRRELRAALPKFLTIYRAVAVATSPPTAGSVKRLLASAGMYAGTPAANRRGALYRLSVRHAARSGAAAPKKEGSKESFDDFPAALDNEDDDLPF